MEPQGPAGIIAPHDGTWRSLVSALVWGTRGRRFKSGRPDDMDRIVTIPNILSLARLATVPVFVALFVTDHTDAAVILYAVGASTDFFDGWIARRFDQVSEIGKLLDPLADRVFIAALVIALVVTDILGLWVALVIIGRDVLILGLYPIVHHGALQKIRVNFAGKSATAALLVGATSLAITETSLDWDRWLEVPGRALIGFGAVLYWVSAAIYAREALALKHEKEPVVAA